MKTNAQTTENLQSAATTANTRSRTSAGAAPEKTPAQLIEDYDRRRFRYSLGAVVGITLMLPDWILASAVENTPWESPLVFVAVAGLIALLFFGTQAAILSTAINSDHALKAALNNEATRHYNNKSMIYGFGAALVISLSMMILDRFLPLGTITVGTACKSVYLVSLWVFYVSRVIYYKTRG